MLKYLSGSKDLTSVINFYNSKYYTSDHLVIVIYYFIYISSSCKCESQILKLQQFLVKFDKYTIKLPQF